MGIISKILNILYRKRNPVNWQGLRQLKPLEDDFGFNRGTPVDRYYIEKFLQTHAHFIKGDVLEIGENTYTKKFADAGVHSEILNYHADDSGNSVAGDLTNPETLPANSADCFICTQTLNFIFDINKAVEGIRHVLKINGTALVTVAGLCQVSKYDYDRWGDYWRFTDQSVKKVFEKSFGNKNIEVVTYGNVLAATCLLQGITVEDITKAELDHPDLLYQVVIGIVAKK